LTRVVLDCRRLLCPLPVIRVQDRVALLAAGDEVEAVCTDQGALHDIPAWCRINGHEVLATYSAAGEHVVVVRVGSAQEPPGAD
jgi:tRNA 2-thiouridine synthesizing protein A